VDDTGIAMRHKLTDNFLRLIRSTRENGRGIWQLSERMQAIAEDGVGFRFGGTDHALNKIHVLARALRGQVIANYRSALWLDLY